MLEPCLRPRLSLTHPYLSFAGVSWFFVYRTEEYKRLKKHIEQLTAKIEKKKSEDGSGGGSGEGGRSGQAKKVNALDEQLKARNRDLSMTKFKSTFFVGVILLFVFGFLNHLFEGVPVAKLPFEPFSLLRGMSHRGLSGSDATDCSMVFMYVLGNMGIRANIQKFLGFTPQTPAQSWLTPPQEK